MRAASWVVGGLLLAACGGRANKTEGDAPAVVSSAAGAAPADTSAPSGGAAPDASLPDAEAGAPLVNAGEPGAGGAPEVPSLIEPGSRGCQDARDCLGLDCITKAGQDLGVCSVSCADNDPCSSDERCVSGKGLEPACFMRCELGTECNYPFDCFDPDANGQFVCVPAPWAVDWRGPPP